MKGGRIKKSTVPDYDGRYNFDNQPILATSSPSGENFIQQSVLTRRVSNIYQIKEANTLHLTIIKSSYILISPIWFSY